MKAEARPGLGPERIECRGCWWVKPEGVNPSNVKQALYTCRRFPPVAIQGRDERGGPVTGFVFPTVMGEWQCGEWKPRNDIA